MHQSSLVGCKAAQSLSFPCRVCCDTFLPTGRIDVPDQGAGPIITPICQPSKNDLRDDFVSPPRDPLEQDELFVSDLLLEMLSESLLASLGRAVANDPERQFLPRGADCCDNRDTQFWIAREIGRDTLNSARGNRDLMVTDERLVRLLGIENVSSAASVEASADFARKLCDDFIADPRATPNMSAPKRQTMAPQKALSPSACKHSFSRLSVSVLHRVSHVHIV
jgi:hypothetical protein